MRYPFALALLFQPLVATAQQITLRGTVSTSRPASTGSGATRVNVPITGANVFIIETLDGALSDSTGAWSFTTAHRGRAMLVVKAAGFAEVRRRVELPSAEPFIVVLRKATQTLAPTNVVASRYAASDERGATLTTLDVVSTPGTNADVMRAIQSLPGVQSVDEGTGLYVRGGDYLESHVLLNDAVLHTAFTFESPNGTFIGTVDPFLLDGIYFSSGGFGARYGNALSGIAALNTLGAPRRNTLTAGAGLAALSLSGAARIGTTAGVRIAANQFDTDLLFKVNGTTQEYDTPPRGYDRSGSIIWNYRPAAELKVFGIAQNTNLESIVEEPSYTGAYALDLDSHLAVANWRDVWGPWSPSVRVSDTRLERIQDYGAFRLLTGQRYRGASAQIDWSPSGSVTLRTGAEWERTWSELNGSIPDFSFDKAPGARVTLVGSRTNGTRVAPFGEADVVVGPRTRLVAGLRADNSTLSGQTTLDPRISTAITLMRGVVFTGAWGVYHQVPDPIFYDDTVGRVGLNSMRATHVIAGVQAGSEGRMIRLELFDKRYRELAQVTRDFDVVAGGIGSSRGADLFVSGSGIPGMRWRVSLSSIVSRRTDPNTGVLTRSAFDVTNSITTVVNHAITPRWHLGFTHRYATGRPFTPVQGAVFDATNSVWVPQYAPPMSERLPSFRRVDLGLTHLRRIGRSNTVFYTSLSNVFDRENVYAYRYTRDYSARIPIRSIFKRSFYVGASFTQ